MLERLLLPALKFMLVGGGTHPSVQKDHHVTNGGGEPNINV